MTKKIIAMDTETTGMKVEAGNRIIEIGCVELEQSKEGLRKTGKTFQVYLNPGRSSEYGALKVHGITDDFLKDKPKFIEEADKFIEFIKGAELVIHNAAFDIKFLNNELNLANKGTLWDHVTNVVCTLNLDRRLFKEERKHSLDAICERYGISTEHRELHGALLDSELLADCYIETLNRFPVDEIEADLEQRNWKRPEIKRYDGFSFADVNLSEQDIELNNFVMKDIYEKEKITPPDNQRNMKVKLG